MATQTITINNEIYHELGERWYTAKDDPIALLRAEARLLGPWIQAAIVNAFGERPVRILDIGCGGGFYSNYLSSLGHNVTAVDLSEESLAIAKKHDLSGGVRYLKADAAALPFSDGAFDIVLAMDFLEHVSDVKKVVTEAGRVTGQGGLFFFHTFNRNFLSWLIIIKAVEWLIPNTPPQLHVLSMFHRPSEISLACQQAGLSDTVFFGTKPLLGRLRHWYSILVKRQVPDDFAFAFTKSLGLAYCGMTRKRS